MVGYLNDRWASCLHYICSLCVLVADVSRFLLQAKERMSQLEENILQAQNREGQILDMTQWMSEMTDLLQSRLDADILAGDVPDEYEV